MTEVEYIDRLMSGKTCKDFEPYEHIINKKECSYERR